MPSFAKSKQQVMFFFLKTFLVCNWSCREICNFNGIYMRFVISMASAGLESRNSCRFKFPALTFLWSQKKAELLIYDLLAAFMKLKA